MIDGDEAPTIDGDKAPATDALNNGVTIVTGVIIIFILINNYIYCIVTSPLPPAHSPSSPLSLA